MRSYIPGSVTDQTRFLAKSDHGPSRLCYGLRRYVPGVAPEVLRCVPLRPNTPRLCPGQRRQSPGVTTASHGSRTAKPRCLQYHMNINEMFVERMTDMSFAKYRTRVTYQGEDEQQYEW